MKAIRHMGALLVALAVLMAAMACRGPMGAQGPPGPQGAPGDPGEPAPDTAPVLSATVEDQRYTRGLSIVPLVLPAATGGEGRLAYSAEPLPPGLKLDVWRTLRGVPTEAGEWEVVYRVDDADGNRSDSDAATTRFTITVVEPPPPPPAPEDPPGGGPAGGPADDDPPAEPPPAGGPSGDPPPPGPTNSPCPADVVAQVGQVCGTACGGVIGHNEDGTPIRGDCSANDPSMVEMVYTLADDCVLVCGIPPDQI